MTTRYEPVAAAVAVVVGANAARLERSHPIVMACTTKWTPRPEIVGSPAAPRSDAHDLAECLYGTRAVRAEFGDRAAGLLVLVSPPPLERLDDQAELEARLSSAA
jgi:hypothetical protein